MYYIGTPTPHTFDFEYCHTLTIERDGEQIFSGYIDNVTYNQAIAVFERNKQTMIDTEPAGTTITLINGAYGTLAEFTN